MRYFELSLLRDEHSVNMGSYSQAWEPKHHSRNRSLAMTLALGKCQESIGAEQAQEEWK